MNYAAQRVSTQPRIATVHILTLAPVPSTTTSSLSTYPNRLNLGYQAYPTTYSPLAHINFEAPAPMPPSKTSSDKNDIALDGLKVTLEIIAELADLSPARCVGPMINTFVKIIQIFQVGVPQATSLVSCHDSLMLY